MMQNSTLYKSLKSRDLIVLGLIAIFVTVAALFILNILAANKEKFSNYQKAVGTAVALERQASDVDYLFKNYVGLTHTSSINQISQVSYEQILLEYQNYLELLDVLVHAMETEIIRQEKTLKTQISYLAQTSDTLSKQFKSFQSSRATLTQPLILNNLQELNNTLTGIVSTTLSHEFTAPGFKTYQKRHTELFISISTMFLCAFGMLFLLLKQTTIIRGLRSQFYQAQKMEALGRLAGSIAHDFNNVLAAIMGYADLLSDDLKDAPDKQKFAHQISKAGEQAQQLVEQILAYSRHSQAARVPINIIDEVNEVISLFKASASPNVHISSSIKIDNATVFGNSNQLHQVLMNICVNADDAVGDEKGQINVTIDHFSHNNPYFEQLHIKKPTKDNAATLNSPGQKIISTKKQTLLLLGLLDRKQEYISITIEDNGHGITKENATQIFDPFFTTKSGVKGTGLGLSAAHGIIIKHDGAIVMDTVKGKGTRFIIILPISNQELITQVPPLEDETEIQGRGNIMLVEDELTVATMACHMLERAGYEVIHCFNAVEALEAIKDTSVSYDLILTDYKMPHMTGLELADKLQSSHPDLPVIIISGYSEERLQGITHKNIKAVLAKPVKANVLTQTIHDALQE